MVAIEDDESMQRNGLVMIIIGLPKIRFPRTVGNNILNGIPFRVVACHFFLFNNTLSPLAKFVLGKLGKEVRFRTRIHLEGMIPTTTVAAWHIRMNPHSHCRFNVVSVGLCRIRSF